MELAEKRALERGWTIVGRFSDRSISASTGEKRPGYDQMMTLVKAGGADVIAVRHYDRLYRQPRELEGLIDDTEGIYIEAVYGGGYDLGTADGRLTLRNGAAGRRAKITYLSLEVISGPGFNGR